MARRNRPLLVLARQVINLRAETDYETTSAQVREATELRSGGVWALAFAILIASVGLNVNSTAVVIGAMLISPLMGPIVGAGFALGTDDLALFRVSMRNLLVSTGIALAASTLYFALSPLADAQSELLARTRPTLYDVLIALFGGGAGIVAMSRSANRSTVVPGVAIATALMPPLCTAGFGLAHLDWTIFFGALNLFLINALFICVATLTFVRVMRFERITAEDDASTGRARILVFAMTLALALPSAYTAWVAVQETRFKGTARRFVAERLGSGDRSLLNVQFIYGRDSSTIDATLLGDPLSAATIDSLRGQLAEFGIARTRLVLRQPLAKQLSPAQVGELVREGIQRSGDARTSRATDAGLAAKDAQLLLLQTELAEARELELVVRPLAKELASLYPTLLSIAIGRQATVADTGSSVPMKVGVVLRWRRLPSVAERARVRSWLALRLATDSLMVTNDVGN